MTRRRARVLPMLVIKVSRDSLNEEGLLFYLFDHSSHHVRVEEEVSAKLVDRHNF